MYPKYNYNMQCPYENYYCHQAGSGIGVIYKGTPYQRGHGIGSFLGGLFRSVLPLLSSGAKAIGKEALSTGVGVLSDMFNARPIDGSIKTRLKEASSNLKRKIDNKIDNINMSGSGYKVKRKRLSSSIPKLATKVNTLKKSKSNYENISDIFS